MREAGFRSYFREFAPQFHILDTLVNLETRQLTYEATLDLLARHNLQATFFLIGRYALAQPALVRRIAAAGHTLGNHTLTHPRLPLCTHTCIRAELTDAQRAIEDTTGVPVRLFRPPHGYRTPFVLHTARDLDLTPTTWNIIGNDWRLPTARAITDRVLAGIAHNESRGLASNIVLHDGSQATPTADRQRTVAATAALIDHLRAQNIRFVSLTDWL